MAILALLLPLAYLPLLFLPSAAFDSASRGGCFEGSGGDSIGPGSGQRGGCPAIVDQEDALQLLQVRSRGEEEGVSTATQTKAGAGAVNCADQDWPCTTDNREKARFKVAVNLDGDSQTSADPSYTSIYQYSRDAQHSVNKYVADWGQYKFTETQQFVFTGQQDSSLNGHTIHVKVWPSDGSVAKYVISFLGGENGDYKTVYSISKHDAGDGDGIVIDWTKILSSWKPPASAGNYYDNPIHLSVTPIKSDGSITGEGLMIFIAGIAYPPYDESSWCKDWDGICCYLKADTSTGNTLPYDWMPVAWDYYHGPYSQFSKHPEKCFLYGAGGTGIRKVQWDHGVVTSTLNQIIKTNPSTPLRIVIAAQTTIDFPLSNFYSDDKGKSGYDAGRSPFKIEVTGFGRINGYAAQFIDHGDLYNMQARLLWLSNNGGLSKQLGTSANAWPVAMRTQGDFYWYTGRKGSNDGQSAKYSVVVSRVQVGYGPPIGDAPVQLGDLEGSSGGAVLLFDAKYISFSVRADGFSMRNPASYGKALFIHGSDDLLKTVTGIDKNMPWTALAITFFGGFRDYGSLSCPCCFGPTGGYQPVNVNFCKDIYVQDLLVPIIFAPWPSKDCYNSPGLVASKWGVRCGGEDAFPIKATSTIYVENIKYVNLLIVNNPYNFILVPLVNWQMTSNDQKRRVTYELDSLAVGFYNVFCDSYFRGELGWFFYNWGIGDTYEAHVKGDGIIDTKGISAHMSSPAKGVDGTAPCTLGYGGDLKWRSCPIYDPSHNTAPFGYTVDLKTAQGCGAYDSKGEIRYQQACASVGHPGLDMARPTLRMYGSLTCQTTKPFCGLSFWYQP